MTQLCNLDKLSIYHFPTLYLCLCKHQLYIELIGSSWYMEDNIHMFHLEESSMFQCKPVEHMYEVRFHELWYRYHSIHKYHHWELSVCRCTCLGCIRLCLVTSCSRVGTHHKFHHLSRLSLTSKSLRRIDSYRELSYQLDKIGMCHLWWEFRLIYRCQLSK